MKNIIISIIAALSINFIYAQSGGGIKVMEINEKIKNESYHIRAYKGDILNIALSCEYKNEKKGKRYDLNSVKIYRQFADDVFQHIISKNEVEELTVDIPVPSDGIYTIEIERGGLSSFKTNLSAYRVPENDSLAAVNKKAVMVMIPDTLHSFKNDSIVYDKIRISTPYLKTETMKFSEDKLFLDIAYALRIGNEYAIPIQMPFELQHEFKKAKSMKWGFMISVGDEVYNALKGKMAEVATAAINIGVGKVMSGPVDEVTGAANPNKLQKGYEIFDKAATANEVASISGDIGEQTNNKTVTKSSGVVATITGFTGLTETAGKKIGGFAPKIGDKVHWEIYSRDEYIRYNGNQPSKSIKKGLNGYAADTFNVKNANDIFYLVIRNERDVKGKNILDDLEALGKTVLSQYVYVSVKVFVNQEIESKYYKGDFEKSFVPLYNPKINHTESIEYKNRVIFEDQMKPYYKVVSSANIY